MPVVQSRFVVRSFATLVFFTLLAGQFWRNLLGGWGFGALAVLVLAGSVVGLVRLRPDWLWARFPRSLGVFLVVATLSIPWSADPGASLFGVAELWAMTVAALFLALCLSWAELLRTLAAALRWVLGLSLLFELIVGVFVRQPVPPFWVAQPAGEVPDAFYWSRALLFRGGPIEGIVADRTVLGFVALLAVIVFGVQLAAHTIRRGWGIGWLALAAIVLLLTRPVTVSLAAVVVAVTLVFALWTRSRGPQRRRPVYVVAAASVVAGGVAVATLAPVLSLPAQTDWLDVWLQAGVIGLLAALALVLSSLWRSWFLAVDRPRTSVVDTLPYAVSAVLPLLLLVALLAQSLAEGRLLVEYGWVLLVVTSVTTKRQQALHAPMP